MSTDPHEALDTALELLGFGEDKPIYYRSNLVRAIQAYAVATRDVGLASACEDRLYRLQAGEPPLRRD